jgi:hypothetical protein
MKIIDDFLPSYQFKQIVDVLNNNYFPWYYNDGICYRNDPFYQYKHSFYSSRLNEKSEYLNLWDFTCRKLGVKKLHRIKVNATGRTLFKRNTGFHIDALPCPTTAILYINTCNGYTMFKEGGKVKSVANRMIIFNSNQYHAGVTCTDEKRRIVVNFNYV